MDIKKTSYKKLSKLLSTFEKKVEPDQIPSSICSSRTIHVIILSRRKNTPGQAKSHRMWGMQGLLTTKVVHKQDKLTAVNRGHKLYTAFAPKERSEAAAAIGSDSASTSGNTITVTYSYRSLWSSPSPLLATSQLQYLGCLPCMFARCNPSCSVPCII